MLFRPIRKTKIMNSIIRAKINFKGAAVSPSSWRLFIYNKKSIYYATLEISLPVPIAGIAIVCCSSSSTALKTSNKSSGTSFWRLFEFSTKWATNLQCSFPALVILNFSDVRTHSFLFLHCLAISFPPLLTNFFESWLAANTLQLQLHLCLPSCLGHETAKWLRVKLPPALLHTIPGGNYIVAF